MSTNYINIGTINNDHHREMTVNVPAGTNVSELVRAFFGKDAEDIQADTSSTIPPDFFCISQKFSEQNIRERLDAELAQATSKIDYCRALYRLQHMGCININQYASDAQRASVFNNFQSKYNLAPNDFCRARMN